MRPIEDVIEDLCWFDGTYKREEIDEIVARKEESVPHLIEILDRVYIAPRQFASHESFFGHHYAILILGHLGEERAHHRIVTLASLPDELPHELFGETITENLSVILLNTCSGDFQSIRALAENTAADEFCRSAALQAMTYGVVTGRCSRDNAFGFVRGFLEHRHREEPSVLHDTAASYLLDLYPADAMDLIREAYEDGYISPGYIRLEDFEEAVTAGADACMEQLQARYDRASLDDIHGSMSWWACFQTEPPKTKAAAQKVPTGKKKKKNRQKAKMAKKSRRTNRKKK